MARFPQLQDFIGRIETDMATGAFDRALNRITSLGEHVYGDTAAATFVTGSATLDARCLDIGAAIIGRHPARAEPTQPPRVVYVATELVYPGGHTFVLRDLIQAQPAMEHIVVLTAALGPVDGGAAQRFLGSDVELLVNPDPRPAATVRWLTEVFDSWSPQRIIHLGHPYDAPSIAALQPGAAPEIIVYGHVDHTFSLGRYLPHAQLATFRSAGYRQATQLDGIENVVYLPLTAGTPPGRKSVWEAPLVTASSGYWPKFAAPYQYRYWTEVPRWMAATGGRHVHVGQLHPRIHGAITAGMASEGIEPDRFVYIPGTASLGAELLSQGVDLYLDSFPLAGCRSVLEAMSVGIPVLVHHHANSELLSNETLVYPDAVSWRDPDELVDYLGSIDLAQLSSEGDRARTYYAEHHSPELLERALSGPLAEADSPELRPYQKSQISSYLRRVARADAGSARVAQQVYRSFGSALDAAHGEVPQGPKWMARASQALYEIALDDASRTGAEDDAEPDEEEMRQLEVESSMARMVPALLNDDGLLDKQRISRALFAMALPENPAGS